MTTPAAGRCVTNVFVGSICVDRCLFSFFPRPCPRFPFYFKASAWPRLLQPDVFFCLPFPYQIQGVGLTTPPNASACNLPRSFPQLVTLAMTPALLSPPGRVTKSARLFSQRFPAVSVWPPAFPSSSLLRRPRRAAATVVPQRDGAPKSSCKEIYRVLVCPRGQTSGRVGDTIAIHIQDASAILHPILGRASPTLLADTSRVWFSFVKALAAPPPTRNNFYSNAVKKL